MIDYTFYRKIGEDGIDHLFEEKDPDVLSQTVESNMSDIPYVDQVETTNHCNVKCVMCPRGRVNHMTRDLVHMGRDLFVKIIDEIEEIEQEKKRRGIGRKDFLADPPPDLVWNGSVNDICDLRLHHFGSPMLDPGMIDKVAYVKRNTSLGIHFSETASNLRPRKARQLFDAGLDRLTIALDGTNAEEFYRIRGLRVDFDRVVRTIQEIIRLRIQGNYPTALFIQLIQMQGAPKEQFVKDWEAQDGVTILHKPFFPYPDVPHDLMATGDKVFNRRCKIPFTSVTVLSDGRVVPCNSDYNGEQIFGDLKESSLQEVWASEIFREFRSKFIHALFEKSDLCNRCGYYPHYKDKDTKKLKILPSTCE